MLVSQLSVFLQRLIDDFTELLRQLGVYLCQGNRLSVQNHIVDNRCCVALKCHSTSGHLVQYCTEGKQIRSCIKLLTTSLLWRHISDGAQGAARTREVVRVDV